ncbi:hypothetical protein LZ30DRAFT_719202 [Colletotrichum cereale]|nr:hypothetical protein LZ30DRAFT_719202 [Colletotrichum cereale]
MPGNGNNPNGYGYGNNPHSNTNGSSAPSYSPADATSYMAARSAANQAAYAVTFSSTPGHGANRGPNSAATMGFAYGSRPSPTTTTNTNGAGRTTWNDGPCYPSGPPNAANLAAIAAHQAQNPHEYIPGGGGNGSGPSNGFGGGWGGPNRPALMSTTGSGWPGTTPGTACDVSGHDGAANGLEDSNEHGYGNAWGHGGYNGNAWGHGGNGNGQDPAL